MLKISYKVTIGKENKEQYNSPSEHGNISEKHDLKIDQYCHILNSRQIKIIPTMKE